MPSYKRSTRLVTAKALQDVPFRESGNLSVPLREASDNPKSLHDLVALGRVPLAEHIVRNGLAPMVRDMYGRSVIR